MSDALVILNARDCIQAKRLLAQLPIAKIWMTGYTERELASGVFEWMLDKSDFDRYIVTADDILVSPQALAAVLLALDHGCDVATGYSQRSHTDFTVNVTATPLRDTKPTVEAYNFMQLKDVVSWPVGLIPTWFAGFSITGMERELWKQYGFRCYVDGDDDPGYASDFFLSSSLQADRVPIAAVREAFCYHWRNEWQHTNHPDDDRVFVGQVKKEVTLWPADAGAAYHSAERIA